MVLMVLEVVRQVLLVLLVLLVRQVLLVLLVRLVCQESSCDLTAIKATCLLKFNDSCSR